MRICSSLFLDIDPAPRPTASTGELLLKVTEAARQSCIPFAHFGFRSICTVDGVAVKSNQEMILRLVWMKEETRDKTLLKLRSIPRDKLKAQSFPPGSSISLSLVRNADCDAPL